MHPLSIADQTRILQAVRELHRVTCMDELRSGTVHLAMRLIGADFGSFNQLSKSSSTLIRSARYPDVSHRVDPHLPAFSAYFHEHPILRFAQRTGRVDAQRFSDVIPRPEWERTHLYNEYFRPIGVRHQMIVSFDLRDKSCLAVSLNRASRDFSDREMVMFDLLRPHFAQACENVLHRQLLQAVVNGLEKAQDALPHGMIVVGSNGRIHWMSKTAHHGLKHGWRVDAGPGSLLPDPLRRWLATSRAADGVGFLRPPHALRVRGADEEWEIRLAGEDEEGNVTLLLTRTSVAADAARGLPELTPRENEIVRWIARGKPSPEIATRLGLSVRTVYKHVENIFRKLGVENRAGVILRARGK